MRWTLADEEVGGQPALFAVDGLTGPERGTGRLSGLEFLHVNAKKILNRVPPPAPFGFDWTINVYRGCSHACTYCLEGQTPILMADGRTLPLADVCVGDVVVGTEGAGADRRLVPTSVLAHWPTTRRAWRVDLADHTRVIGSGDHRLLSDSGWKYIAEGPSVLGPSDHLVRADASLTPVVNVENLGLDLPMFDITTGTGDFIADGVVSHNCFARPTHEYLGLDVGADFDRKIVVKINAVERVRAELRDPRWAGESVAMGTNTDPYQRCEGKYRLTRGVVEALTEHSNPFSILTKSALVTRDLDLLTKAARRAEVSVSFSIATLDERVWRATEPGTPHPLRRIEAMRRMADAGIRTGALIAPVLPAMSDSSEQLAEVSAAIRDAGGEVLSVFPLYLRPKVREHFLGWLAGFDPALHADYLRRYEGRTHAPEEYIERLRAAVGRPRKEAGRVKP